MFVVLNNDADNNGVYMQHQFHLLRPEQLPAMVDHIKSVAEALCINYICVCNQTALRADRVGKSNNGNWRLMLIPSSAKESNYRHTHTMDWIAIATTSRIQFGRLFCQLAQLSIYRHLLFLISHADIYYDYYYSHCGWNTVPVSCSCARAM